LLIDHVDNNPGNDGSTAPIAVPKADGLGQIGADAASLLLLAPVSLMLGAVPVSVARRRPGESGSAP